MSDRPESPRKRYNLQLPSGMFDDLDAIADAEGVDRLTVIRVFLRLGKMVYDAQSDSLTNESGLVIRDNEGSETKIVVLF